MEILLWLVPPVVVTVLAMTWVSWLGREGRGEVDREESLARLARALDAEGGRARPGYAAAPAPEDRSSGVAVRAPRPPAGQPAERPVERPVERATEPPTERPTERPVTPAAGAPPVDAPHPQRHREAS